MLEIALKIIICLIIAAILGGMIGYLLGRLKCNKSSSTKQDISVGKKPKFLVSPRKGKKNNLTRIKGIGIKIEETLNSIGIYHFDQIASWNSEEINWVDSNVAFPGRVKREQWLEQAKILARGKDTEFSQRVDAGQISSSKKS